ncbi:hypothetical protein C8J56DRAFT_713833, partial [Mycena floridula]
MHLKTYLQLGEDRPTWAYVANTLIQKHRNVTDGVKEDSCSNMFLQKWNTAPFRLPLVLYNMLSTAKKYGIEFNSTCLSIDTLNKIPIWHHLSGDLEKTQYNNQATDLCLQSVHKVFTTGEAVSITGRLTNNEHLPSQLCECEDCLEDINQGCKNPHSC